MLKWIQCLWQDLKAWRRGERRIAPRPATRGRVYARKDDNPGKPGNHLTARAAPKARITATIIDGKSGERFTPEEWKNRGVIANG